jgi:ABC-type tungstate transport system permease subunit
MISIKTLVVHAPKDNIVFAEKNINVSLEDEAGGYYVVITDNMDGGKICIDFDEVDEVFQAIKQLQKQVENL